MSTIFKLFINSNDSDGAFINFTAKVVSMEWQLGFTDELQHVAPLSTATIVLDNLQGLVADDVYNHEVVIKSETGPGPTGRTLWTGWGRSIKLSQDFTTMTLQCVGLEEPLYTQRISIPIQLDRKASIILNFIIKQVNFKLRNFQNVLILNDPDTGFVGKLIADSTKITINLDTGVQTFPYAGDRWDNALAIDIIKDIVTSDSGRFYTTRLGFMTFKDKNSLIKGTGISITDLAATDSSLITGSTLFNASQISFSGRFVGTPGSVLFQIDEALKIRPGKSRKIKCRFRDSNDNPSGATVVNPLFADTNYTANRNEAGTASNQTENINLDTIAEDGNSITLEIHHTKPFDIWLTKLEITGTPLSKSDPMTVEVVDFPAAVKDGYRYISSSAPLLSTAELAEDAARFELGRRTLSDDIYNSAEFDASLDDDFLAASILDEIDITSSNMNIFAEHHQVDAQKLHSSRLTLGYTWNIYGILPFTLDSSGPRSRLG